MKNIIAHLEQYLHTLTTIMTTCATLSYLASWCAAACLVVFFCVPGAPDGWLVAAGALAMTSGAPLFIKRP